MDKKAPQPQTKPKFSHLKALVYANAGIRLVTLVTLIKNAQTEVPGRPRRVTGFVSRQS